MPEPRRPFLEKLSWLAGVLALALAVLPWISITPEQVCKYLWCLNGHGPQAAASSPDPKPVPPSSLPTSAQFTSWLDPDQYQREFDSSARRMLYTARVEGSLVNGEPRFRAAFEPIPNPNFAFYSHHGLSRSMFEERHSQLTQAGFSLIWTQSFKDRDGIERYQATWAKGK